MTDMADMKACETCMILCCGHTHLKRNEEPHSLHEMEDHVHLGGERGTA